MASCKKDWKEREKKRRRSEILLAAERCFSEKNYHDCTIEDIAKEYGCSVGSIYNFFSGKKDIYQAIFAMRSAETTELIDNFNPDTDDPLKAISEFILVRLEMGSSHQNAIKIFFRNRMQESFVADSMWNETVLPMIKHSRAKLKTYFEAGIQKGLFRDDLDVDMLVRMIDQNIFHTLEKAVCVDDLLECENQISLSRQRDFLMEVLFNGIKTGR